MLMCVFGKELGEEDLSYVFPTNSHLPWGDIVQIFSCCKTRYAFKVSARKVWSLIKYKYNKPS